MFPICALPAASKLTSQGLEAPENKLCYDYITKINNYKLTNEVDNLDVVSEVFVGGEVRVGGAGHHVVGEGEVSGDVPGGPGAVEGVQQTLVPAVEGAAGHRVLDQLPEGVEVGPEDEHAGVEAVGPPGVGRGGELLPVEQLVRVLDQEGVRVKEDTLGVVSKSPALDLRTEGM